MGYGAEYASMGRQIDAWSHFYRSILSPGRTGVSLISLINTGSVH